MKFRNIALSGSYGSGKSSVINSYEQSRSDKKFLHITLADFEEQNQSKSADRKNEVENLKPTVDLLEGKILNQLLHQIDAENIPQSRFHSKNTDSPKIKKGVVVWSVLFFLSLFYTRHFDSWKTMIDALPPGPFNISWSAHPSFRIVILLLCLLSGGTALFFLMRNFDLRRLLKKLNINIKGIVDVEIFEEKDDSVFDRYLDEVLYLFEHSGADIIVFEDLDRYDVTQIFGKLKEISDLLYQRKKLRDSQFPDGQENREQNTDRGNTQGKEQKTVQPPVPKFFYLIRDDIFSSSDRTKFFDFIIPVIPVISTGNSYALMLKRFKEAGLSGSFNETFLRDVSLYLSDMRLVHNVVNEYILYHNTLVDNDIKRDPNHQLAIIIYKNLFPKDFENLQHGEGYISYILDWKNNLLASKQKRIAEEEQQLKERLKQSSAEHLQSIDELNALYFPFQGRVYQIDGNVLNQNLSHLELVKSLMQANSFSYINTNGSRSNEDPQKLRQRMEDNPTYQTRKKALEDKESSQSSALNHRLAELTNELHRLNTLTLSELIDAQDDDFGEPSNTKYDLSGNRYFSLLKYLISQGYIDEHYTFYISYFYPGSLTAHDTNFCMALTIHQALGYDYALDNPAAVLEWIHDSYFSRSELSNFALFNYLIEQNRTKELYLWLDSIEQRCKLDTSAFKFPIALWKQSPHHASLVQLINERMPHWFGMWTPLGLISGNEWRQYAVETLLHSNDCTLHIMNDEN